MASASKIKGKLIIFSAPSGAGKTTIVKHLLNRGFNLTFSISVTSRASRPNEINGKDYYFISKEEFKEKIKQKEFLEWEEVYNGTYYGTLKKEIEKIRQSGKNIIFDVDVIGGLNIKKYYKNEALSVFIKPPSLKKLEERLRKRSTENEELIRLRIVKAEYEISFASQFDQIIVNDTLPNTLKEAERIVSEFLDKH